MAGIRIDGNPNEFDRALPSNRRELEILRQQIKEALLSSRNFDEANLVDNFESVLKEIAREDELDGRREQEEIDFQ